MDRKEIKENVLKLIDESKEIMFLFSDSLNKSKDGYKKQSKFETSVLGYVYQSWYSKAIKIIKTILPDRLNEFNSIYLPDSKRKNLDPLNYTISDFINGFSSGLVRRDLGLKLLYNQVDILSSAIGVIESRLSDIVLELKFSLNEKEIDASKKLLASGYYRSAGAICGVILEEFLQTKIKECNKTIIKKAPTLGDIIQFSYEENVIDVGTYKKLIFLNDIRNKCDHKKSSEPTKQEIESMIFETELVISCN